MCRRNCTFTGEDKKDSKKKVEETRRATLKEGQS